jgi:preprotein translocase subunit SecE
VDVKKAIEFLGEVRGELNKVTWPTRKDTLNSTYVVLIVVVVFAAYLGVVDNILAWLVREILG